MLFVTSLAGVGEACLVKGGYVRILQTLCFTILLGTVFLQGTLLAESIKVLVLDPVSGKPQNGVEVHYLCQRSPRNSPHKSGMTNPEGFVSVQDGCSRDEEIEFWVTALPKEECGGLPALALREILSVGIVSAADGPGDMQCPTKISNKLKPLPGQVVIFIKKPNWWQSHF